jgi:phosphoglycolate phosphatase
VYLQDTMLVPGIPEALAELAASNRLAVATSKSSRFAGPLLDSLGIAEKFQVLGAPDPDSYGERKEETIRSVLSKVGAAHAVMVGDRSYDVLAAHECAIPAIGVLWGIGSRQELIDTGVEAIIDTPSELADAVNQLLR